MKLSVILPLLNEEPNIEPLYAELRDALAELKLDAEIVFIDDGSTDASFALLQRLRAADPRVKIIRFRRNFGQTAALAAGFAHARGEIIVTMDADRQNDPRDIGKLLETIDAGYDLVNGWRFARQDAWLSRKLPSRIANKIISLTTNVKLHDYGCTLKAFRREVVQNINLYGEMHRFIPAIASWMGVSIAEVKVNHRARTQGKSKYGISRTLRVILDLITVKFLLSYSGRPIQFFGPLGLLCGGAGLALTGVLAVQRLFFGVPLSDRPILLLGVLLIFIGLQFITFGLLGEMQTRIYHEGQNKPIYVIREILD